MDGPNLSESYKYVLYQTWARNKYYGTPYDSLHKLLGVLLGQNVLCKLVNVQYSLKENDEKCILFFLGEKTFVRRT